MGKTVAILQPNYIPWRGYFDLMSRVDEFILYDDTQYTRRDWRNRNKIIQAGKIQWLSIPVEARGKYDQLIKDVRIADSSWQKTHLKSLQHAYAKAPFFDDLWEGLSEVYARKPYSWLLDADIDFLNFIKAYLGLATKITLSSDYQALGARTEKLVALCLAAGASAYVSGPSARSYIETSHFETAGVALSYIAYPRYPDYAHVSRYDAHVSILDAMMHCGRDTAEHFQNHALRSAA